jgi:hypothetical protein
MAVPTSTRVRLVGGAARDTAETRESRQEPGSPIARNARPSELEPDDLSRQHS